MDVAALIALAETNGFQTVARVLLAGGPDAGALFSAINDVLSTPAAHEDTPVGRATRLLSILANAGYRPGEPITQKSAKRIIQIWLAGSGWIADRWGNYKKPPDEATRYQFGDRVLRKQQRYREVSPGHSTAVWYNASSQSHIDAATNIMVNLAKKAGVGVEAAQAQHAARRTGKEKQSARAKVQAQSAADTVNYTRQEMAAHYLLVLRWAQGKATDREVDHLRAETTSASNRQTDDDGRLFSLDRPPFPWLVPGRYVWEEEGYTVELRSDDGIVYFTIGSFGTGGIGADPTSFSLKFDPINRTGDGYASGIIRRGPPPQVDLTLIGTNEGKRAGIGKRLLSLVLRLVAGLGADTLIVSSLTDEGAAYFLHLIKTNWHGIRVLQQANRALLLTFLEEHK